MQRILRTRYLTDNEAVYYNSICQLVEKEFPPMNAKEASKFSDISNYTERIFDKIKTYALQGYRKCTYNIYSETKITNESLQNIVVHLKSLGYYVDYKFVVNRWEINIRWN